jgi:hypothetical protein
MAGFDSCKDTFPHARLGGRLRLLRAAPYDKIYRKSKTVLLNCGLRQSTRNTCSRTSRVSGETAVPLRGGRFAMQAVAREGMSAAIGRKSTQRLNRHFPTDAVW